MTRKENQQFDMWKTCKYVYRMSKMIQLRNVPDDLHKVLKSRAALAGTSLSDYLIAEIQRLAEHPTVEELRRRLQTRTRVRPTVPPAQLIREERDNR